LRDTYKIRLVPDELLDAARYPETIASNPLVGEAAKDGSRVPPVARAGAFTGSQNAGEQNGEAVTPSGPPLPIGVPSGNAAPVLASGGEEMAGKTPGYVIDRILGVTGSDGSRGSGGKEAKEDPRVALEKIFTGEWVATAVPAVFRSVIGFLSSGIGGFLGVFGYLLSFIIVPLYLFYLLAEAESIKKYWGNLLPLKASRFRDEVVDTVNEINRYLIAFFRGQLVVSFINGIATCTGLMFVGLDFSLIIGIAHCFLGTIPYVGNILCWIPAVIIASVQGGSWLIPATAPGWVFPLVVTGIFVVWQQIDGLFITPKIVGDQVGLHPMTVMFSVFFWSMILGGLLGAILAIPLTATLKVVMKRYVWDRTILGQGVVAEISS
jgi:predicted PurR-regulated permease PerM